MFSLRCIATGTYSDHFRPVTELWHPKRSAYDRTQIDRTHKWLTTGDTNIAPLRTANTRIAKSNEEKGRVNGRYTYVYLHQTINQQRSLQIYN
jgi:hypothetical protein